MTDIPHEAAETAAFVPPSLRNLPSPPSFLLRPGTRRDRKLHQRLLFKEGLRSYGKADMRAETLKALEALWSPDQFALHEPQLRAFWEAADQHNLTNSGEPFEHPERDAIDELIRRVTDNWERLREMTADVVAFREDSPKLLLAILLGGWTGIEVSFGRAGGVVPMDRIDEIEEALAKIEIERQGKIDGIIGPGIAFLELCAEATNSTFLTADDVKNSASPSQSTSSPTSSKAAGKARKRGLSTAKAIPETPES